MAGEAKRLELRATLSGPFFERDPKATVRQNIRSMMDAIAAEGEKDIRSQIASRAGSMPYSTGWSEKHVAGRTASLGSKRWAVTAVVSLSGAGMSKRDAIRTRAAGASIERRFHPFRRTTTAIRSARAIMAADLTKGLE